MRDPYAPNTDHTKYEWRFDPQFGLYVCISHPDINMTLADHLWCHGFEIPDTIHYCLAVSEHYSIKFRQSGYKITYYLTPIN